MMLRSSAIGTMPHQAQRTAASCPKVRRRDSSASKSTGLFFAIPIFRPPSVLSCNRMVKEKFLLFRGSAGPSWTADRNNVPDVAPRKRRFDCGTVPSEDEYYGLGRLRSPSRWGRLRKVQNEPATPRSTSKSWVGKLRGAGSAGSGLAVKMNHRLALLWHPDQFHVRPEMATLRFAARNAQ